MYQTIYFFKIKLQKIGKSQFRVIFGKNFCQIFGRQLPTRVRGPWLLWTWVHSWVNVAHILEPWKVHEREWMWLTFWANEREWTWLMKNVNFPTSEYWNTKFKDQKMNAMHGGHFLIFVYYELWCTTIACTSIQSVFQCKKWLISWMVYR